VARRRSRLPLVLQLADLVGPEGRVIGVDIASLLLDAARERASGLDHVSFIEGDAVVLDLSGESIDAFFSRFGVMAFPDPAAAFSHFRRMLKPTGRLAFVCWRSVEENELNLLPLRAAGLEHLLPPAT
jgi:ubiquinone/menaquinone biosynthesis C-methylase UbiE